MPYGTATLPVRTTVGIRDANVGITNMQPIRGCDDDPVKLNLKYGKKKRGKKERETLK